MTWPHVYTCRTQDGDGRTDNRAWPPTPNPGAHWWLPHRLAQGHHAATQPFICSKPGSTPQAPWNCVEGASPGAPATAAPSWTHGRRTPGSREVPQGTPHTPLPAAATSGSPQREEGRGCPCYAFGVGVPGNTRSQHVSATFYVLGPGSVHVHGGSSAPLASRAPGLGPGVQPRRPHTPHAGPGSWGDAGDAGPHLGPGDAEDTGSI